MNHVILSGFEDLPEDDQESVIEHVMYKGNWARLINRQDKEKAAEDTVSTQLAKSDAVVPVSNAQRHPFIIPVPGVDGARPNSLARKTFVLTGIFPEVDGGTGLRLGQDRVRSMIEAFGGRVTTAISGKTDVLVVGKEPGFSKVSRSRFRKIQLVNLKDLKEKGIVDGGLEDAEKAVVGRRRKGLSLEPDKNVAITAGESPPQLTEEIAVTKRKQLSRKAKDANSPAKRAKEALLRPEPAE